MNTTVIFSDVHLKVAATDRPRHQQFIDFLSHLTELDCHRLICLGDLFDFWFEYRHVIFSGYFEVLRAFARLRDEKVECHLVCGNHDFWAGRFLREELGFHLHSHPVTLDIDGQRVHFAHGDGINQQDLGYRVYKHVARNRAVIGLFRLLHPDWAMTLARGVSHGSRTLLQTTDPATGPEARAIRGYALRVLDRDDADVVMCGHAHAPVIETLTCGGHQKRYINTGDWLRHRSYVVWNGSDYQLLDFGAIDPSIEVTRPVT